MSYRVATVGGLLLVLALTACGGSNDSDEPSTRTSSPNEEAASAPVVPQASDTRKPVLSKSPPALRTTTPPPPMAAPLNPATQEPPPAPGNLAACKTAQLSVRVIRQSGTGKGGPNVGLVTLTNKGTKPCALSGWPSVALTRGGAPVDVRTMNVNQPRSPVAVAVQPQRTAFAGLQWRNCPPTATGCRTGDGFRVGAPGSNTATAELAGFSTAEQKGFTVGRIAIGALQSTTTDIINW